MEQKILKLIGVKGTFKKDVVPMMNYSSANITTSGAGYVVSLYYMKFLTDVVNLPLEWAGRNHRPSYGYHHRQNPFKIR